MAQTPFNSRREDLVMLSTDAIRGEDSTTGSGSDLALRGGESTGGNGDGANVTITGGIPDTLGNAGGLVLASAASIAGATGNSGNISITGGTAGSTDGAGGAVTVTAGDSTGAIDAADVTITAGTAGGTGAGGDVSLQPGTGTPNGNLVLAYSTWPSTDAAGVLTSDGVGGLTWGAGGGGVTDLQTAYVGGNTITTSAGEGILGVSGDQQISLATTATTADGILISNTDGGSDHASLAFTEDGTTSTGHLESSQGAGIGYVTTYATTTESWVDIDAGASGPEPGTVYLTSNLPVSASSVGSVYLIKGVLRGGVETGSPAPFQILTDTATMLSGGELTTPQIYLSGETAASHRSGYMTIYTGNSGGDVIIGGGNTTSGSADGGSISLFSGAGAAGGGVGGDIRLDTGDAEISNAGDVLLNPGQGSSGARSGSIFGNLQFANDAGLGGEFRITASNIANASSTAGGFELSAANITSAANPADGGSLEFNAGGVAVGGGAGGDVTITGGVSTGAGDGGSIILTPGTSTSGTDGEVTINGKLTVTGLIDPTGLIFTQEDQANVPTIATEGALFVSDGTAPATVANALYYKNGAGALTNVSGGEDLAATLALGNATGGTAIVTADASGTPNSLVLTGGSSTGAGGDGADVNISGGVADTTGDGGNVVIASGSAPGTGAAGDVVLAGSASTSGADGTVRISGANQSLHGGTGTRRFQILGGVQDASGFVDSDGPSVFLRAQGSATQNGAEVNIGHALLGSGSFTGRGGNAISGNASGGSSSLLAGEGFGTGNGGGVTVAAGAGGNSGGDGGTSFISGGLPSGTGNADGGGVVLTARNGRGTGAAGSLLFTTGNSGTGATGDGGAFTVNVGNAVSTDGAGGAVSINAGDGNGTGDGGDITLTPGTAGGTGEDGAVRAAGPLILPSFTVGTVPSVTVFEGGLIYVTDEVGGRVPAYSDGTNWRRVSDGAVIST